MASHRKPHWQSIAANAIGESLGQGISDVVRPSVQAFGSALGDAVVGSIVGGDQKKAPQKQEPEYQSKPLTQADIDGFLSGLDDIPGASPSPGAISDAKGMTFSENSKYRAALRAQGIDPDAPDAPVTQGIQGKYVKVKSGDTVSGLMGSSSPQAVGAFLAGNDMTNSNLRVGQMVFVPNDVNAFGAQGRLGQSTLNSDNRRLALAAETATANNQGFLTISPELAALGAGPSFSSGLRGQAGLYSVNASPTAIRSSMSTGEYYGSLAEGASNAQYVSAMLDSGLEAGGKAAGAAKLLPAGALQQARVEALMSTKNLEAAQALIKGPTAKSALAMAEYGGKYAGTFKALPYLGATLSIAEEANRVYRADGWQETTKVASVGVGNYFADGAVTTGGAWAGAKAGAFGGAVFGSFVPVVGTGVGALVGGVVGTIGGAVGGHWFYDSKIAPEVRAKVIGEKFRDAD
jgi:hypothetical protein